MHCPALAGPVSGGPSRTTSHQQPPRCALPTPDRLRWSAPRSAVPPRPASSAAAARRRRSHVLFAKPEKVTAEQLEVELGDRQKPLIIDFYATWCGPCVLLAKELEQVAEQVGDSVKILKIDTDENPELSSQLQIQGLPTLVFVGTDVTKPAFRTEGLLPAGEILKVLDMVKQGDGVSSAA